MSDPAIPAATLVVARDRAGGAPQILMVERAAGMAFAGGALVFPGGRIDEADKQLAQELGLSGAALAAVRETLEETAVPAALAPVPGVEQALHLQAELVAGRDFGELLREQRLSVDGAALVEFARWVPKFHASRRFDTLFLLAEAPPGDWAPNAIEGECSGAFWVSAQEVLGRDRAGEARLIFPTRRNLERIALHRDIDAAVADANRHSIDPIVPWVEQRDGVDFLCIPEDRGYPRTAEPADTALRG